MHFHHNFPLAVPFLDTMTIMTVNLGSYETGWWASFTLGLMCIGGT